MSSRLLLLNILLIASRSFATDPIDPKVSPPKAPVLRKAPNFSSWTIGIQYIKEKSIATPGASGTGKTNTSPQEGDRVISITVEKTGTTYRETVQYRSGRKDVKWIVNGLHVVAQPYSKSVVRLPAAAAESSDYGRSDFEDLEWIGLDNYTGGVMYQGKPAYLFESSFSKKRLTPREQAAVSELLAADQLANEDAKTGKTVTQADVITELYGDKTGKVVLDVETQLPLAFEDGTVRKTFTYNAPPSAPLVPPPQFQNEFRVWASEATERNHHPPPP